MKLQADNQNRIVRLVLILAGTVLLVIAALHLVIGRVGYELAENPVVELGSEKRVADLFARVDYGSLVDGDALIDTSELGTKTRSVEFLSPFGLKRTVETSYRVVDAVKPEIIGDDEIDVYKNSPEGILEHYSVEGVGMRDATFSLSGDCDYSVIQKCHMKVMARSVHGGSVSKEIVLNIIEDPEVLSLGLNEYYIAVNRSHNVVLVYALDRNGEYSKLAKTFVASTGLDESETPLGTYNISGKYEELLLVGDVWGHYATQISGPYLFHSVPYYTKGEPNWDNLEYIEYNKLGEKASAGCVRLSTKDAKWIYDNIDYGTTVDIYDGDLPEGVEKPKPITIDVTSPNRGWDPTDPDENNPWH